jgi:serine/threonine protein phosphatase PrpC
MTLGALFLLSKLRLFGELSPFGFAFWAAASRSEPKKMAGLGAVLVLVPVVGKDSAAVLELLLAMGIFWLVTDRMSRLKVSLPALAGLSLLAGSLPRFWLSSLHTYDLVLVGLEIALAVLATAIFYQVRTIPPRKVAAGEDIEGAVAWTVTMGLILLSLVQAGWLWELLAGGAARLLVLWAAFLLGPGLAAAVGALLGFLLGIQGEGLMWLSVLTFAGLMAGLFRPYGRLAQVLGFLLGSGSLALYLNGWAAARTEILPAGAAALIFLTYPVLPYRIRLLAPFFRKEAAAEDVRKLTSTRIRDYALVFRELADAFRQAATAAENEPALASLAGELAARVCTDCPSYRRCWHKETRRTYNSILHILSDQNRAKDSRDERVMDFVSRHCRRKEEFVRALHLVREIGEVNGRWQQRIENINGFVSGQLQGLSQILLELGREVNSQAAGQAARKRRFHVEIGVAQVPKGEEEACGDYYSYLELRDGRQAFILSDGMGKGNKARQESSSTVALVEQLLLAGFRQEQVIRTVNTILQLRSRDESFATLDAILVDPAEGEAEFLKIGAAPSYLRQSDGVAEIRSPSVPLGILSDVELKAVSADLKDGALVVMLTDGILDAVPEEPDWLKSFLAETDLEHPQVLADEIVRLALIKSGKKRTRDDLTVLVCHIRQYRPKIRDCVSAAGGASSN